MSAWESKVNALLGACTSSGAFGCSARHNPASGASQDIRGVWSNVYITADPETGMEIMASTPNLGVRLSDLITYPKNDDGITHNNIIYIVRAVEPDGEGGATLVLEERE